MSGFTGGYQNLGPDVGLDTAEVTGTLPVANGGTGAVTLTGILKGNGTSAVTAVTAPTGTIVGTSDSQVLTNKTIVLGNNTVSGTTVTAGTLTRTVSGALQRSYHKFTWTNANITALSGTVNNIKVCTLPAKTRVERALIIITGQEGTLTGLTVSLGRVGTAYIDYVVASSAKAAANTVYGDGAAEVGTGLSAILGDLPSITGTTDVYVQFLSAVENLSNATGSTGEIHLETVQMP